jgi:hypothetical protein
MGPDLPRPWKNVSYDVGAALCFSAVTVETPVDRLARVVADVRGRGQVIGLSPVIRDPTAAPRARDEGDQGMRISAGSLG